MIGDKSCPVVALSLVSARPGDAAFLEEPLVRT